MADQTATSGEQKPRKWRDLGDGSFAPSVYDERRQDLTAAAPDDHTVTTSSTVALAVNANRKGCIIINVGSVKVSLGLDGNAAVLNRGITLSANGAWTMGEYDFTTGEIQAIADTGGSTLAIQEFN